MSVAYPRQINGLASAARTTATTFNFSPAEDAVALTVVIVSTAQGAAPSLTFNVEAFDDASSTWIPILASAVVTAAGTRVLRVDPRTPLIANLVAQCALFPKMRLNIAVANADSLTYSVGLILSA